MKNKVYGYCRVSTMKQSIERQIRNVKEKYPDAVIVTDEYTGTKLDRPGWMKLYKNLQPGDTVVFDQVSRMSRDADEGFRVYEELYNLGVNLIFLKEPFLNTSVYKESQKDTIGMTGDEIADCYIEATNKVLMILAKRQIKTAFDQAEKEVEDLHQRTREGIRERKRKNAEILFKYNGNIDKARTDSEWGEVGQPKGAKLTTKKSIEAKEVIRKRSKDFNGDLSDLEVMKLTGVARGTYYKYKRELKGETV